MTRERSARSAGKIEPADVKNGRYVKPFAELELEQLWVGFREVWTATHGRASRYHVLYDNGAAMCRRTHQTNYGLILLAENTLIPILQMEAHMACMRNGCRQIFEALIR